MSVCKVFGHKFRPRYHLSIPQVHIPPQILGVHGPEKFMNRYYLHDICERCGLIVRT